MTVRMNGWRHPRFPLAAQPRLPGEGRGPVSSIPEKLDPGLGRDDEDYASCCGRAPQPTRTQLRAFDDAIAASTTFWIS